ncbi:ribosome biogenesis protein BMS1 homolog isoform X2 [Uloborus diversus]|uniref:ribosome biogenesis protein BMS1 homolog isoform X2 n=1 Tax=Uloborus diversus TaxID=327109 RepID=UPI00240A7013|nr:ribosome biogenesis protein BMS1 homolog isoform X2 [Uloborus diversus]
MGDIENDARKPHRTAHSGRKAGKKDAKKKKQIDHGNFGQPRNPKAFAIQSTTKAERRFRRTMDIKSKGYHVPTVDRTPARPSPAIVALVGPPKVGKTTLLKCLIKNFTRQKMTSIQGPITLISGKKKRITFIECSNDINMMIDVAKIADLVLLLIDAKSGFEMETFEFMNICQVHGMPRLMGVLTHLDLFKNKKGLQKTKTILKKRYRTEIPRGEKMFYLSGILHGEYLKNEVHNLGRFISVMKFEASAWKKTHPYVLVDRMEDITDHELLASNPIANRTVCLYGYARGGALKKNSHYHVPGCGDYLIKNIHFLPDPCPLPDKNKKRSLNEKERLIYAPMCGVGGIVYDKDAVYIELKEKKEATVEEDKPSDKLVNSMVSVQHTIDEKMKATQIQLFPGDKPLNESEMSSEDEESDNSDNESASNADSEEEDDDEAGDSSEEDSDDEGENSSDDNSEEGEESSGKLTKKISGKTLKSSKKRKVTFADEDSDGSNNSKASLTSKKQKFSNDSHDDDDEFEELGGAKWKHNLKQKAADEFYERQKESFNLQKLVYGQRHIQGSDDSDSEDEIGGLFRIAKYEREKKDSKCDNGLDCSKLVLTISREWMDEKEMEKIRDCFVTGKWDEHEDAEKLLSDEEELYGDFEDLETGVVHKGKETVSEKAEGENKTENEDPEKAEEKEKSLQEKRLEKKKKLKEIFNKQFDDAEGRAYHDDLKMEADKQGELNKKEFEDLDDEDRVQFEGYRPGLYLRMEIEEMPCEFVKNFDPSYPVIVGSLLNGEDKLGYLQVRIKKHRWYPKILKSRDPLIISLGWRRFQTIPLYYIVDHNKRNRHLKYTPKHLHCMAAVWGPITQQKSGILGVQTVSEITSNFRIAAVGSVTEVNQMTNIVKKLKLVGTPLEIFKKTAFIEGMFHSPPEVVKYEGAAIRTASGIRGQVKKALRVPPGVFRATFEDKILKSDLIFLRTWVSVVVPKFCILVTSLLLPVGQKANWEGAKTLGRLRYEKGLHAPVSEDSNYKPIERKFKQFAPLVVPKNLQKALPFKDKIVHMPKKKKDPENERVAVIKEPKEREVSKMLNMLKTVHQMKVKKENKAMWLRARAHRKQKKKEEVIHHQKVQQMKKRILRKRISKPPPDA